MDKVNECYVFTPSAYTSGVGTALETVNPAVGLVLYMTPPPVFFNPNPNFQLANSNPFFRVHLPLH